MSEPHFDRYQFDGFYRNRPVSAESRIDWSDYERMGTTKSSVPLRYAGYVPAFAMNNEQLRAVILECERRRSHMRGNELGESFNKHMQAVRRAGGYRAFIAAIAYRAWRLRRDSIDIAQEMEISPVDVRQHLFRLVRVARALGFEAPPPRKAKEFTPKELRARRNARRETIRRRLFGKPDYQEGVHCWGCRVRLIDHEHNKWYCAICLEKRNEVARRWFRKKYGIPQHRAKYAHPTMRGRKASAETRAKQSAFHKAWWAARKSGMPK